MEAVSTRAGYSAVKVELWDPRISLLLPPRPLPSCDSGPVSAILLGKMKPLGGPRGLKQESWVEFSPLPPPH